MAGALGAIGTGSAASVVLTSCGGGEKAAALKPLKEPGTYYIPELPDLATDGQELKAGVIGWTWFRCRFQLPERSKWRNYCCVG